MQSVIRKRVSARRARLRRDGRMLGRLSFSASAQREVSSISGSVPHRLVDVSDREWLNLEIIGIPFRLTTVLIMELEQGRKRAGVRAENGGTPRAGARAQYRRNASAGS